MEHFDNNISLSSAAMPTNRSLTAEALQQRQASATQHESSREEGSQGQEKSCFKRLNVLLGITGSVAAIKGPEIAVRLVEEAHVNVRVLLTQGGKNFWTKADEYNPQYWKEFQARSRLGSTVPISAATDNGEEPIYIHYAEDEWNNWDRMGDPVLHIDLRDWADVLVIAPLSAHTLAKLAHGLCDDTLSCVVRAWDFGHGVRPGKPLILAPAMNTAMWLHPLTQLQLATVQSFWKDTSTEQHGINIVSPQVKTLACGEVGDGALAPVDDIIDAVRSHMKR